MRKKLVNMKEISRVCAVCGKGKLSSDGESVFCVKKGVMNRDSVCGRFQYDPLKRVPLKSPKLPHYDKEEFEL